MYGFNPLLIHLSQRSFRFHPLKFADWMGIMGIFLTKCDIQVYIIRVTDSTYHEGRSWDKSAQDGLSNLSS